MHPYSLTLLLFSSAAAAFYIISYPILSSVGQELSGSLVSEIMYLPSLLSLTLSFNDFAGRLPMAYNRLQRLDLNYNRLTGVIPTGFFENATSLRQFNIGANIFAGTIPADIVKAKNLQNIHLFENLFVGILPLQIYNLPLLELRVHNNFFTGSLPWDRIDMSQWVSSLERLSLSSNSFSGTLPQMLGTFGNLDELVLSHNQFVGSIPENIGNGAGVVVVLRHLYLNGNGLNGTLNSALSRVTTLEQLDVSSNQLTGTIPSELALLTSLELLHISSNELVGKVPSELALSLTDLESFELGLNLLSGSIPDTFCAISSLDILEADCLGGDDAGGDGVAGWTPCQCCSTCCNSTAGTCVEQ
jgi:Leucine-rich repeat (LRR) protein